MQAIRQPQLNSAWARQRVATLQQAMGAEWVSYRDVLPVNRAMPFWLDIPEGEEIDPVTLAWAQGSGWLWKIPTQPGQKLEQTAVGHFLRAAQAVAKGMDASIPTLPPPTGVRELIATEGKGRLEVHDGVRVLFLAGTPEEMGRQQGTLVKKEVRNLVDRILYGVGVGSSIAKGRWFFGEIEEAQSRLQKHMDPRYLAEAYSADLQECSGNYVRYRIVDWQDVDAYPLKKDGFRYTEEEYLKCMRSGKGWQCQRDNGQRNRKTRHGTILRGHA